MHKLNYSIQIICEGKNTEPAFFNSLRDEIEKGKFNTSFKIKLLPEFVNDKSGNVISKRGLYNSKKRPVNGVEVEDEKIKGIPPLNWVSKGQENLDTYDEVWVVFDKDGHPKVSEAFEQAKMEINGKRVNIAFSSICFEYYLLLHFERLYKPFEKSECGEKVYNGKGPKRKSKTMHFHCVTAKAIEGKACNGDKCINGYARLNGYWEESKKKESTYDLIRDRLLIGLSNSIWLRKQILLHESDKPIYEQNPYTDVDQLIARLTGWNYLDRNQSITTTNLRSNLKIVRLENGSIKFINIGDSLLVIPQNSFSVIGSVDKKKTFGCRILIEPGCEEIESSVNDMNCFYTFKIEDFKLLF